MPFPRQQPAASSNDPESAHEPKGPSGRPKNTQPQEQTTQPQEQKTQQPGPGV